MNFSALVAPVTVNLTPTIVQPEVQIQNPFGTSGPIFIMPVGPPLSTVNWDPSAPVIENVVGGQTSDMISGSTANNVLSGGDGSDVIMTGTAGGNDTFNGGEGGDAIMLSGNGATAHGGNDNDFLQAFNEPISNTFSGSARLFGEAGDDNIFGAAASDYLSGGKGRDFLSDSGGLASNDVYKFERGFGADTVADSNGTDDTADLRAYSRSEIEEIRAADLAGAIFIGGPDGMLDSRVIEFKDGSMVAFMNYYGNTSADLNSSIPGTGFVENVELKDGALAAAAMNAMTTEASTQEETRIESRIASQPKPDEIPDGAEIPENFK